MYSAKHNVLQLVALMKAHGIRQVVIAPGSRNAPLAHSFATDPFFTCHTVVDERSAGFYALGLILHGKAPAAVCCTSGTAVLNLAPAIAEACYQQLPLLAVTADRPAAWIGQMDGQTIPQPGIFNELVRKAVQLPEGVTAEEQWHCNRLINEALLALEHHGRGPVQINVPLAEPLFDFSVEQLPDVRTINRFPLKPACDADLLCSRFASFERKMILVGQMEAGSGINESLSLLASRGCAVLAEHLSNTAGTPGVVSRFDEALYSLPREQKPSYAPDLLITLGGHIVSKRIKQMLRDHPPAAHWHVSESGEVSDLIRHVTDIIEAHPCDAAASLARADTPAGDYGERWNALCGSLPPVSAPYSDLSAVGRFLQALPDHAALHLANSSSVRLAQLFPLAGGTQVYCNRGTSGIEGCVSTAVGYAAVSKRPTFLLIGDLAFFYDMNGLWNPQLCGNLRILLNNNGGGEIFYALPGLNKSEALAQYISAPHRMQARAWAESAGCRYLSASNDDELDSALPVFTGEGDGRPMLLEVFSSMKQNTDILRQHYHQL